MRRVLIPLALIATVILVDALANDFRLTSGIYWELREFARLFNRSVGTP